MPSCWQSNFQGNSVTAEFFAGSFCMSLTEKPKQKVHKYEFVWCFLQVGMHWTERCKEARGASTCTVRQFVSGSVPSATCPSTTFCTPYVPPYTHTGVLNTLPNPSIFKFTWIESYWQFFFNIDIATTFTRNLYWHDFGIVMIAQCYHNSTKF